MAYGSQGIQGQDIIPRELLDDYAELFSNAGGIWKVSAISMPV